MMLRAETMILRVEIALYTGLQLSEDRTSNCRKILRFYMVLKAIACKALISLWIFFLAFLLLQRYGGYAPIN